MGRTRIKVAGETAVYHCISRVVAGERLLDDVAKEMLRKMLWKTAAFCGLEVLAYCVMSNHFHVFVRVTAWDAERHLGRDEILRRYRAFYGEVPGSPDFPSSEVLAAKFTEGGEEAERWEARLQARMGDVSEFMKTLKQRFTIWFNKAHRRFGTLWSERFKSVLVEDSAFALKTVAAYIDLNPVRAGLVRDPADYRWCSYAEAMSGNRNMQRSYGRVVGTSLASDDARGDLESYRMVLFGKGGKAVREGQPMIDEVHVKRVLEAGGRVERAELLRLRARHLTEGVVLGSRAFVRRIGTMQREGAREAVRRSSMGNAGEPFSGSKGREATVPVIAGDGEESLVALRKPRCLRC
jgi:REP element-mobilizing transposase RayT